MALSFSQFPFCPSKITSAKTTFSFPMTPNSAKFPRIFASKPLKLAKFTKASQEEDNNTTTSENTSGPIAESQSRNEEMAELGAEIKKAMKERDQAENEGFLSGVAEEIREIEWPPFNKVLGITGVVLGMIAGSSVVLLTLNAVLAELSDRVFAGKGVQDFFG
ncbi:preprotein translocase subunit sece1 [Phtheirospermum japonicum]|uniref:Preprotein translocase subunit sece1 n=1 Tax=Phtheirospermum japonicum TaxID=374723 RepID=A0A830BAD7_9LAMI|nr:preprotein translocase subunit sece1 [Phtheirospermum japonicum]